ncbi:MAG: hypothetical protein CL609_10665 [Anaerolineaceae bacterium]|nr:hypothetical protein [Anaerolineaceae bacterium]
MDDLTGKMIGKYKVIEEIGRGGMAVVYKGIDTLLGRMVAIKIILPDQTTSEKFVKRFLKEAKALANLSHTNIVKVFDYGEFEGLPYLAMEYVTGGSLTSLVGSPVKFEQAVNLLIPIARALEHVHKQKIVHRDVKPANILLNDVGQPLLSDFGILKIVDSEESQGLTGTGMVVGTPAYMAPEQIKGKSIDARVDIYAMGVMFYELLTGKKPYEADSPIELSLKHINDPIPRAKQSIRDLPIEADQIISKAMAKNIDDRYLSMDSFVKDLEKMLKKGTGPNTNSLSDEFESFDPSNNKKNKKWVYLLIPAILIAGGLLYFFVIQDLINPNQYDDSKSVAAAVVETDDLIFKMTSTATEPAPTATLEPTITFTPKPTLTATEFILASATPTIVPLNFISTANVESITEVNRLEKISVIDFDWVEEINKIVNAGSAGISIIDPATMTISQRIPLGGQIPNALAVSENGDSAYVLIGTEVSKFDLNKQQLITEYNVSNGAFSIALSKNGDKIGLGILDNKVQIIESETGRVLSTFRSNYGGWSVLFSNDDKYIAAGTSQGSLVWEVDSGLWIPLQSGQNNKIYSLAFSSDNSQLAAGSNNSIFVWDIPSGTLLHEFTGDFGSVNGVDFSPNNELLVSGSDNSQVIIWDVEQGKKLKTLTNHTSAVFNVRFSPDGEFIASGANEGFIRLWGLP